MTGAEGMLLAIAAGNVYGAIRAAVSAGVSSRPTISRSNVLTYASTLAVTDEVNARSIAPITCSGSLALDLAAVGGRQVDEVVRLQEFLVAGALRVAPDRAAQPRPGRQVHAKAEPRRRNRLSREAAAIDPQARFEAHTGARLIAILEPDRGTCGVSGRTQEQWQSHSDPRTRGAWIARHREPHRRREGRRHVGANRPPPPGAERVHVESGLEQMAAAGAGLNTELLAERDVTHVEVAGEVHHL